MTGKYPHFLRDQSWKKKQNVMSFFLVTDPLHLLLLNVCFSGDETGRFVGILEADVDNFFLLHQMMLLPLLPLPQLTPRRYTKAACILAKDFRRHVERMAEDSLAVHYELVTVRACCRAIWENTGNTYVYVEVIM